MSKRERTILIFALVVAGLYLLDLVVVGPWLERWDEVNRGIEKKREDLDEAEVLLMHEDAVQKEWRKLKNRLEAEDRAGTTETLLVHLDEIGRRAGVKEDIAKISPARWDRVGDFDEIGLEMLLETDIDGLRNLLVEMHNSNEFLKISRLTVNSQLGQRGKKDKLEVDLKVSTIELAPAGKGRNGKGRK